MSRASSLTPYRLSDCLWKRASRNNVLALKWIVELERDCDTRQKNYVVCGPKFVDLGKVDGPTLGQHCEMAWWNWLTCLVGPQSGESVDFGTSTLNTKSWFNDQNCMVGGQLRKKVIRSGSATCLLGIAAASSVPHRLRDPLSLQRLIPSLKKIQKKMSPMLWNGSRGSRETEIGILSI